MTEEEGPHKADLRRVRRWPVLSATGVADFEGLLQFVAGLWWRPDVNWQIRKRRERANGGRGRLIRRYSISTGGWYANEALVEALQGNAAFWLVCWESSRRGGHFEFRVPAE